MARSVWIFDLDNTLTTSSLDYGYAALDFAKFMLGVLGHRAPHHEVIVKLQGEIDRELFKTMRASRDRFPTSFVECYRRICQRVGLTPHPEVEKRCLELGNSALSEEIYRSRLMIPGAEDTLTFLLREGRAVLFCVTAGDHSVQWMKWRGYNLGRFFPTQKEFRVVKWDKFGTLRKLRTVYSDLPAFMVGDSIGSDIQPAAKAGMKPVFVPHLSVWDHGELKDELPVGTVQLSGIAEIKDRFDELVRTD